MTVIQYVFRGQLVRFQGDQAQLNYIAHEEERTPGYLRGVLEELFEKSGRVPRVVNVS